MGGALEDNDIMDNVSWVGTPATTTSATATGARVSEEHGPNRVTNMNMLAG